MAESKSPGIFTKWLGNIGIQLVYKLLLVISVIFIMIEYIITVLEFFIVAGLSALLIPFYFIDATKQFATNILKTIFTYAIKLITTITMVFFTLGMYINLGNFMLQRTELTALSTVFIYVIYCVIGMALVKGTGGLAASIISLLDNKYLRFELCEKIIPTFSNPIDCAIKSTFLFCSSFTKTNSSSSLIICAGS